MAQHADFRVRDLAEMTLTLRSDLAITPRHDGDEPGYVIEDRVNGSTTVSAYPNILLLLSWMEKRRFARPLALLLTLSPSMR